MLHAVRIGKHQACGEDKRGWMAEIGRFTPIGEAIIGLRAVLIGGKGSFQLGGDGGLLWMIGISVAYLLVGVLVFNLGESIARRHGSLGRY